jgi:hypothetical protein
LSDFDDNHRIAYVRNAVAIHVSWKVQSTSLNESYWLHIA